MPLRVTKSNRAEVLLGVLCDELQRAGFDPFVAPTVVIGADGVRRWLAHGLSERFGVCAQVRFVYPGRLAHEALDLLAPDPSPAPWRDEALAWAVLAALPSLLNQGDFGPLRSYLTEPGRDDPHVDGLKPYLLARELADVLRRAQVFRPELLAAWARGEGPPERGAPWLPALWRAVRARLAARPPA
ncbi:MAG: hypothetical protein D6731_00410, partial [Planctomycetota bacterium]